MFQSPSESSTQLAVPEISASERLLAVQELAKLNEQNPNGNDDLNTASKRLEFLQDISKEYHDARARLQLNDYSSSLTEDEMEEINRAHSELKQLDFKIRIAALEAKSEISLLRFIGSFERSEFRLPKRDLITWIVDLIEQNDSRLEKLQRSDMRSPRAQYIWDKLTEQGYDFYFKKYEDDTKWAATNTTWLIGIAVKVPNFKLHE